MRKSTSYKTRNLLLEVIKEEFENVCRYGLGKEIASELESVLYYQKAIGKNNTKIIVPKIRTMYKGADKHFADLSSQCEIDSHGKIKDDPRVTPIGKFLRKNYIDEFLQVPWNVIIMRNMDFIGGTRPGGGHHHEKYSDDIIEEIPKHKPAILTPPYRKKTNSFEESEQLIREYWVEEKENRTKARARLFFDVMYNIIVEKQRSK